MKKEIRVFSDLRGYDTIQRYIELEFPKLINKEEKQITNICIVGAYYGEEIYRLLRLYPNANIIAFEPYPKNFEVLYSCFKNDSRVKAYPLAISNKKGKVPFYELTAEGNGSLLKFQADELGREGTHIKEVIEVESVPLKEVYDGPLDILWVDVQGAELQVIQSAVLENVLSMFLEIRVKNFKYINAYDVEGYKGQCYLEDIESFLAPTHFLHSIGLDNESQNGQGNSFWLRNANC